jgi:hypothetical protein
MRCTDSRFRREEECGARLGVIGPLEQSDLVGLDLTLAIHEVVL